MVVVNYKYVQFGEELCLVLNVCPLKREAIIVGMLFIL